MSKREWAVAGVLLAMLVVAAVMPLLRQPRSKTPVAEAAYNKALKSKQPIVLCYRFGVRAATTDEKCRTMADLLAKLRERYQGRAALIDVSLDPDTDERFLIEHFKIRKVPTTLLLNPTGKLLEVHEGVWPEAKLTAALDKAVG